MLEAQHPTALPVGSGIATLLLLLMHAVVMSAQALGILVFEKEFEAIDKQTVRIVAWIDQPSTHSRKIVCRLAAPLDVAMAMNVQMQEAFAKLLSELEQQNAIEKAYED